MEFFYITGVILLSAFFSGSEMAFISANKLKLEIESRKNSSISRTLTYFHQNPETFLTTTLVGNNIVNVLYATLMAIFLAEPIRSLYSGFFGELPSSATVLIIQTIVASVLILIFGEILSKAIFRVHADFMVRFVALPLRAINFLLWPLIELSDRTARVLINLLQTGSEHPGKIFRRQDIEMIFKELRNSGGSEEIDQDDSELLHNLLELSNKRVRETMVPRTEIVAVEKEARIEELKNAFIESGYSKIPVYQESIDDIIGVVFAYDLFNNPNSISDILRPVKLIPSSKKSKDLLTEFRQSNTSVAIVIDEYGGTAGMVTIEDLIEEVVGDIQDEYDKEYDIIKKIADDTFLISGSAELDELLDEHPEIFLPHSEGNFETIAGYIIHHLGRIPKVNEEVQLLGNTFVILKATQSKLESIKLILNTGDPVA
ncbi:MAG: HlyC/CorC family transporter [Balneolaceae bacterium]|nr:MAG: HlyC/CorC family transporter [Balneolaceae bacterium]